MQRTMWLPLILSLSLGATGSSAQVGAAEGLQISLDAPASGPVFRPFTVAGWAIDNRAAIGTGVDAVHVWAWPATGQPPVWIGSHYGSARADVAAVLGARFVNSGFVLSAPASLPVGGYTLVIYARSAVTGETVQRAVAITVNAGQQMALDGPAIGATVRQPFVVSGWAVDRVAPAGTGVDTVHVWAYPAAGGAPRWVGADYGGARPDVGGAIGDSRFDPSGYRTTARDLPPGSYRIVAFARSTVTGLFDAQQSADVVVMSNAQMAIDGPFDGTTVAQPFAISGWAADPGAAHSTGVDTVHVWAYPADGGTPRWVGSNYGIARADVAAAFGDARFSLSGYRVLSTGLPPGRYLLVVSGRSTLDGQFRAVQSTTVTIEPPVTLAGAGDIGNCSPAGAASTGALLTTLAPTVVFTAGDNAYENGTAAQFATCYDPYWGTHKPITRPSPGNHDYGTPNASAYLEVLGPNAGPSGLGYYSYDLGGWHVISLNSEIAASAGSLQETWLRADLAAHPSACTVAYWHRPRFTSGPHSADTSPSTMIDIWRTLYEFGADVIVNGHDHTYERFGLQQTDGLADAARGIRQFVVGTGGAGLTAFVTAKPNSQVRIQGSWGVLRLTLGTDAYAWEFVDTGNVVRDAGVGDCVR